MMNKVSEEWGSLQHISQIGLYQKAYRDVMPYNIYCTYRYPENYFGIAFSFSNSFSINIILFNDMKDIRMSLMADNSRPGSNLLFIELVNLSYQDIFSVLCENLIEAVLHAKDEHTLVKGVLNQLTKWRKLFSNKAKGILSSKEQQGLYGELYFLKKFLQNRGDNNLLDIVKTWVGMYEETRDFQGTEWAVECKASASSMPQLIKINGERQLDETLLDNLFLYVLSVDIVNGKTCTLPDIIQELKTYLKTDQLALSSFEEKLMTAGYWDKDKDEYSEKCYKIRREAFYKIEGDFPRIKEKDLRDGVGQVHYMIAIDKCQQFMVSDYQIFNIIKAI